MPWLEQKKKTRKTENQQQIINEIQTSLAPQDGRNSLDRIHATGESSSRRANGYAQFKPHSATLLFIMMLVFRVVYARPTLGWPNTQEYPVRPAIHCQMARGVQAKIIK